MTRLEAAILSLVCLYALVTMVCSSVARRTSRRGSRIFCARCLQPWTEACNTAHDTPADREFKRLIREALDSSGSSSLSAPTAVPPTAGNTAATTTTGTGGSPNPDSADDDDLRYWRELRERSAAADQAFLQPRLQHNPHSVRIDASSRNQFGMCDYPEEK